ncbi:hypothetical protein MRB53_027758, partial [Persea americana]
WNACVSNDKEESKRAEMSCYWKENPRGMPDRAFPNYEWSGLNVSF